MLKALFWSAGCCLTQVFVFYTSFGEQTKNNLCRMLEIYLKVQIKLFPLSCVMIGPTNTQGWVALARNTAQGGEILTQFLWWGGLFTTGNQSKKTIQLPKKKHVSFFHMGCHDNIFYPTYCTNITIKSWRWSQHQQVTVVDRAWTLNQNTTDSTGRTLLSQKVQSSAHFKRIKRGLSKQITINL